MTSPAASPLTADDPAAAVNLPLGPGPLIVELDPAANGPILDRVRLIDPLVLLRQGEDEAR